MNRDKAQSTLEYLILLIIVIGAFVATQTYIKRGFQGRWKETVDGFADQYDPATVTSLIDYSLVSSSNTVIQAVPATDPVTGAQGFMTNRIDTTNSTESRQGEIIVGAP